MRCRFGGAVFLGGSNVFEYESKQGQMPIVYLVGSVLSFSDTVLRMAAAEFAEVSFVRVDMLTDLDAEKDGRRVLAIVVDEAGLQGFLRGLSGHRARYPEARFALAYRCVQAARGLLTIQMRDAATSDISFLPMNMRFDHWLSILRLMLCGEDYLPREVVSDVTLPLSNSGAVKADSAGNVRELTAREREILGLVARGMQNKLIAAELGLSEHTVKLHIHHVIAKLGVHNRTEAAAWYHANTPAYDVSA